ncbi:hypothetical protein CSKR_105727 [Clonorchis sinensis]|uniref:Uncharacterized protein n=1 Tax=Clonorchis sinensis TaxID=79923 RepID=A0A419QGS0_CLOSI|nr:hypothetical protein CSKR_105727 [Clonorchis sinensis]
MALRDGRCSMSLFVVVKFMVVRPLTQKSDRKAEAFGWIWKCISIFTEQVTTHVPSSNLEDQETVFVRALTSDQTASRSLSWTATHELHGGVMAVVASGIDADFLATATEPGIYSTPEPPITNAFVPLTTVPST